MLCYGISVANAMLEEEEKDEGEAEEKEKEVGYTKAITQTKLTR